MPLLEKVRSVWGRDESVFGDWSISLSHVLVDLKRLLFDWLAHGRSARRISVAGKGLNLLCPGLAAAHRSYQCEVYAA